MRETSNRLLAKWHRELLGYTVFLTDRLTLLLEITCVNRHEHSRQGSRCAGSYLLDFNVLSAFTPSAVLAELFTEF